MFLVIPHEKLPRLFRITADHSGRIPDVLAGQYNSEGEAKKAIKIFQERVRAKADALAPNRRRRARKQREKLNA